MEWRIFFSADRPFWMSLYRLRISPIILPRLISRYPTLRDHMMPQAHAIFALIFVDKFRHLYYHQPVKFQDMLNENSSFFSPFPFEISTKTNSFSKEWFSSFHNTFIIFSFSKCGIGGYDFYPSLYGGKINLRYEQLAYFILEWNH